MPNTVFNIVRQDQRAGEILNALRDNGFANRDISIICLAKIREAALSRGENYFLDALEWVPETDMVDFSPEGFYFVTGPLLAAAKHTQESHPRLALLLSSFGLAPERAELCAAKLKRGNVLLAVHADTEASAQRAATVFESTLPYGCMETR